MCLRCQVFILHVLWNHLSILTVWRIVIHQRCKLSKCLKLVKKSSKYFKIVQRLKLPIVHSLVSFLVQ